MIVFYFGSVCFFLGARFEYHALILKKMSCNAESLIDGLCEMVSARKCYNPGHRDLWTAFYTLVLIFRMWLGRTLA